MDFSQLNPEQRQAVEHDGPPLLVVAGAGTGKTRVITARIVHLIKSGHAKPSEILALTFTEKAAREMEERLVEAIGYLFDIKIMTFNSFGDELLRRWGFEIGWPAEPKLLTEPQRLIFMKDHFDAFKLDYFAPVSSVEKNLPELARYFSALKTELISPAAYRRYAVKLQRLADGKVERLEATKHLELSSAYDTYVKLCRGQGLIDFDDQISLSIELLKARPNVLATEQSTLKYVLVDEFQDTNLAQSELLELISAASQLSVVGDDDQSIYKFRGAAISNIIEFKQRHPDAQQIVLTHNYRSTQRLLDSTYRLIKHNDPDRLEVINQIDKRLVGRRGGRAPEVRAFTSYDLEADWLADDLKRHLDRGADPGDIAVLLRKNNQAAIVVRALERRNLPFRLVGQSQSLYQQPDIKNLLDFLQYLVNPWESASLFRSLASDLFGFDIETLQQYGAEAKRYHISLESALRRSTDRVPATVQFLQQVKAWRGKLNSDSVGQISFDILDQTRLIKNLVAAVDRDPSVEWRLVYLNQFFKTFSEYERIATDQTAIGYVGHLPELISGGQVIEGPDSDYPSREIQVMTVHRAKGLEFELVYLFDLTRGTFPSRDLSRGLVLPQSLIRQSRPTVQNSHLEEERRLMYVAMTRAKKELIMTFAADHGSAQLRAPSIFIEEALGESPAPSLGRKGLGLEQIELFRPNTTESTDHLGTGGQLQLSARQIEDYLNCPAEFRWLHVLQVPEPSSAAEAYGSLIHSVIHYYQQQRRLRRVKLSELIALTERDWPPPGFISAGHLQRGLEQAKASIGRFYAREEASGRLPDYSEQSFNFELPEIKLTVRGRFDAVYLGQPDEVRDYKTGGSTIDSDEKAKDRAKNSLQLAIYALAWNSLRGANPRLVLDFVDAGFVGSTAKTRRQLDNIYTKIAGVVAGIRAGEFKHKSGNLYCHHG